jgi:hypothetical protein
MGRKHQSLINKLLHNENIFLYMLADDGAGRRFVLQETIDRIQSQWRNCGRRIQYACRI